MAPPITAKDYIAWVQRSLNRLLGSALMTNGADTTDYRDKVREFKFGYGLGGSADVRVPEQNALIKANHLTPEYVEWAQKTLDTVGAGSGRPATGTMDAATRTAVRSFQSYEGLLDDGWIGAKTETALINASSSHPPGHLTTPRITPGKKEEIQTSIVVRGNVPRIIQKGATCWAAAFAMMYGWKWGKKKIVEIPDEAGDAGWWTKQYNGGHGLSEGHTATLARKIGLTGVRHVPSNWVAKLADHGPLMLVQDSGVPGWLHWIVVVGWRKTMVFPDRSLDREELQYNEPFSGTSPFKNMKVLTEEAKSMSLTHYSWFHF